MTGNGAETFRVALVGLWHVHATDYAKNAAANPLVETVCFWDDDPERAAVWATEWNMPFEPDLDAILANDQIDGVIITTATSDHIEVIPKVARAGKHVFTEKVIAATNQEARAIVDAVENAGITFTVSLPRLSSGYTQTMRTLIDDGSLGDIAYVRVRVSHDGALSRDGGEPWLPARFFNRDEAQGGVMMDFGAHPYYLVRSLLGMPDRLSANYISATGRGVEDEATVVMHYDGKALGVAESSFLGQAPFVIEVHGSLGSAIYTGERGLEVRKAGGSWATMDVPPDLPSPFDRWVNLAMRGERDPDNVAVALDLTALNDAAERSARERRVVALDETPAE